MINKILELISLQLGEERKDKVLQNVKDNISFRGSNLWVLACAIIIASVGLNVNSTAVIIGAMLISPLMGPIVGAGFALAIYDFELLKRAGKNLFVATIVSLSVATLYFYISPFKEVQSELLARTSPTIYDVMIAFFGGLVGVIAMTRVEKGNPIPGVAIATALMPPLCTAGYGLATSNPKFFIGAFYLYAINCFFICFATFIIVKYLKYEQVSALDTKSEKRIRYAISALMIIMIVPSFYLAYNLLQEKKESQKVENFIKNEFTNNGHLLVYKHINFSSKPHKLQLGFLSKKFNNDEVKQLNQKLILYDLNGMQIEIKQETNDLKIEILNELTGHSNGSFAKDIQIHNLKNERQLHNDENSNVLKEIGILFPNLKQVSISKQSANNIDRVVLVYQTDQNTEIEKLRNWLKIKFENKEVVLVNTFQ